jgi:hypothetical protein
MTCPAHPWSLPTGLPCQRADEHEGGHVYHAATDDLGDHGRHCDEDGAA